MIISRGNTQILDAPVTSAASHKATLMKEDYIKLSFVDVVDYGFKAGDSVTYEGQEYFLNKDYIPTMKDEATYSYDLQFNAPWYNLDSYIFFFNTYTIENEEETITKRESEWYITDTASNIINLLIRNTQDTERDCPCKFESIFYCEGTTVKTFTFSSTSILAALNNLAKEFELEWWVEVNDGKYYLHFGECDDSIVTDEDGSVIFNADGSRKKAALGNSRTLTTGTRVNAPSISNKKDLKKKYFVYGSSRNIDQTVDMLSREDGTYVSSLVTKRLAMEGNPQSYESNPTIITEDIGFGEEVVIFDDIYPRSDWQVTHVSSIDIKTDEIDHYDEDDEPVYKEYKAYNIRLGSAHKEGETWVVDNPNGFSDYVFQLIQDDPNVQNIRDVIASGKELSLKFIIKDVDNVTYTPILSGFEFELRAFLNVNIHGEFPNKSEDYEWYEFQIIKQEINGYIIPNQDLIPQVGDWVCLFNIKGKYIDANQVTNAQTELTEAFKKYYKNLKKDVSYTVKPYVNTNIDLNIGAAVILNYGTNTVRSRISSFDKKLDYKIDASYTISSYVQPSTVNQLKEEVKTITANIASGRALQLDTEAINSMLNVYGKKMFLSKVQEDEASGKITFVSGIDVNAAANILSTIGTPQFQSGFTGSGWQADEDGNLTVGNLTVRQTMRVFELLIQQVRATGGEIIVSPANGKIKSITGTYANRYICEIESKGNSFGNMFVLNDLVRCQRWSKNGNSIRNYWARVASVSGDSVELEATWTQPNVPNAGDELVLMGNTTNTSRQAAISITATDDGKPRITVLNGINSTSLSNCTKAVLGDLSSVTDSNFGGQLSGYGLYSDNVFLKGEFHLKNGGSEVNIGEELVSIQTGLGTTGIDIEDGEITLTAGKTNFVNDEGNQIASFTGNGLQSNVVECLDEDGNIRVRLDKDGLKMYYPNGQVMKEEVFVYGPDGVSGAATCYYEEDGTLKWMINTEGELDKGEIDSYWETHDSYYLGDSAISDIVTGAAQGKHNGYVWTETEGSVVNCELSQYHTSSTGSTYNNKFTKADVSYNPPASTVPLLEGWIMNPLTASQSGSNRTRTFEYYRNGERSATGVVFHPTASTTKVLANTSYIKITYNPTTDYVTGYTAYTENGTVIQPTDPTP